MVGRIIKKVNTVIGVAGTAITAYQTMMGIFKWFEKKHGKKQEPIIRPIIKG